MATQSPHKGVPLTPGSESLHKGIVQDLFRSPLVLLKSVYEPKWPIRPELNRVSVALSNWEYCYFPLDGMLVHCRITPSIKFCRYPFIHLGGERCCES